MSVTMYPATLSLFADHKAVGKSLAYTSVKFLNKDDQIVARGSHTKYVSFAWKDEKNITEQLKP